MGNRHIGYCGPRVCSLLIHVEIRQRCLCVLLFLILSFHLLCKTILISCDVMMSHVSLNAKASQLCMIIKSSLGTDNEKSFVSLKDKNESVPLWSLFSTGIRLIVYSNEHPLK